MPVDPIVQAILDQMAALGQTPMDQLTAAEAREQAKAFAPPPPTPEPVAHVEDQRIPVEGGDILARIYRPEGARGTLVYYHGGGWVLGDVEGYDQTCRHLANLAGCTVVSVDYRLAPEFQHPIPGEDCYAAFLWAAERRQELGNSDRIAVGGDSAGGNLAAVVALMARDRGGPEIAHQLLIYPATDYAFETKSYVDNAADLLLTKPMMVWFWDLYVPEAAHAADPYVSPLRAGSHADLPPALVMTAEYDPLRDEGEEYARKLDAAGVPVSLKRYDGYIHGFFGMFAILPGAQAAHEQAAEALRAVFRS